MEITQIATDFLNRKLNKISTSDRIVLSIEAKTIVLKINEIYKVTREPQLMDLMKLMTIKKKKISNFGSQLLNDQKNFYLIVGH